MTKPIGIYLRTFPRVSEAFVTEQAQYLKQYQPTYITDTLLQKTPLPHVALSQDDRFRLKQITHTVTRSPEVFRSYWSHLSNLALIHAHFAPNGVYIMSLAEQLNIPLVVTVHGYDITLNRQAVWRTGKLLYYQLLWHEETLKQRTQVFIAVSDFIREKLIAQGYPQEKIIKHYIGVNTDKFCPSNQLAKERYILCVGRHTEKKGIDTLLRAFAKIVAKYPDIYLFQVGQGALTSKLKRLTKQLGIENRVRFLGPKPHEQVLQLVQKAEIFALPSQVAKTGECEGLPIVILEASACGVPVVSTYHSGIPEAVIDGQTGFLVSEKDDQALAEKLDILLSDRSLGQQMGKQGRKLIKERFDIGKQTAKLEGIYDSLLT
ncbi:glycosyltransferase [Pleurocapsa sp. PCC 7319]|uniref:glycosyltransferase n=1 Tax=Pleurocapsa sp. PCC 7319 TaxID=118161 RepID=UPI00034D2979|nr:glycosyltransferase [Pleurocapsa sp. PCC 7319]